MAISGKFDMVANYYNILTQNFEPFIENWGLKINADQFKLNSIMKVNLESTKMLNLNITYGLASSMKDI